MLVNGFTYPQIIEVTGLQRNAVDYLCRKFKKNGGIRGKRQTYVGGTAEICPPARRQGQRTSNSKSLKAGFQPPYEGQGALQGVKGNGFDLSEIENITTMTAEDRLKLWLVYWQKAFELATDDEDLASIRPLLAQFAAKLVERQSSEPIIQIQPIEFSPVIVPRPVGQLAHDLTDAIVDLLKANLINDDDAQQLVNAVAKYCPHLTPRRA
jgi:hypothetical protein